MAARAAGDGDLMDSPIEIKQEYEFVKVEPKADRVLAAITALGGVATLAEIAREAHLDHTDVSGAIMALPLRRIPECWVLPGVAKRCPGCHQDWPEQVDA